MITGWKKLKNFLNPCSTAVTTNITRKFNFRRYRVQSIRFAVIAVIIFCFAVFFIQSYFYKYSLSRSEKNIPVNRKKSSLTSDSIGIDIRQPVNLTLCAMISGEMPSIIEWIEFYRFQGVDRFILYDDGSEDDTGLLALFYSSQNLAGLIELVPTNFYRNNGPSYDDDWFRYVNTQYTFLDHCNRRSANRSRWIIVVDVDEFVYAPQHDTIWAFLESRTGETEIRPDQPVEKCVSQYIIEAVRYGTSGVLDERFSAFFHYDPYREKNPIFLQSSLQRNQSVPLISLMNSCRGPIENFDADYWQRYNETCLPSADRQYCEHNMGKAIWKPERCEVAGVHECKAGLIGKEKFLSPAELRENHYAYKSLAHIMGLIELMFFDKRTSYEKFDRSWFSSVYDPVPERFMAPLEIAVNGLFFHNEVAVCRNSTLVFQNGTSRRQ